MKRVVIVYGFKGHPSKNWYPYTKSKLEKLSVAVSIPEMPTPAFPNQSEWVNTIKSLITSPDSDTFLVGHSLGVIAILRYLESLADGTFVGGVFSVAGFSEPVGIKEHESFFMTPLDFDKVKRHCLKFVAFQSDNDYYVPMRQAEILRDRLGAELVIVKNAGHFSTRDGYSQMPIILEKLKEIL